MGMHTADPARRRARCRWSSWGSGQAFSAEASDCLGVVVHELDARSLLEWQLQNLSRKLSKSSLEAVRWKRGQLAKLRVLDEARVEPAERTRLETERLVSANS